MEIKDILETYKLAAESEQDNREEAEEDIRFARLSEQWPDPIKQQRDREGRPCLTINRLPTFIRQVVNDARQNKPTIKISPVDSAADPRTAEVLTGLIRNIEMSSDADVAYDTAVDSSVTCGIGYIGVDIDYAFDDSFDLDIKIKRIANPFAIYGDHRSVEADSSDWMYCFVVDKITRDDFKKKFKSAKFQDFESESFAADWVDADDVQIAEYWVREEVEREILQMSDGSIVDEKQYKDNQEVFDMLGLSPVNSRTSRTYKVKQYIISGAEILEENEWPGKYIPVVPVYGDEINVKGKRHFRSLIRDAKDAQRQLNFWRTASTELVALAPKTPFVGPKGAFDYDADKWATANSRSHAYLEYDGDIPPQRQPFAGPPAGALQEALNASDDLKSIMGLYDSSIGARSNETSGIAIRARQAQGDTSTFHFIDNLSRAIRHLGRILIDLIPRVYGKGRVIRILGEDGTEENVPIGQPVEDDGIERIYDLAIGKYDVVVSSGPSFGTKREEAAMQMIELIRSYPDAASIIGDLLVKNLDWPGADEIAERMKKMLPPQLQEGQDGQQGQEQIQAVVQQFQEQMQQLQAQLQEAEAKLNDKQSEMIIEDQKIKIQAYNAETDRLKVIQEQPMTPEQVQALVNQTILQALTPQQEIISNPNQGLI